MESVVETPEIKEVDAKSAFFSKLLTEYRNVIAVIIIGASVLCAMAVLLVFIYVKFFKKKEKPQKKKNKCDHKKDSGTDKAEVEPASERIERLNSVIEDLGKQNKIQEEIEDHEELNNAEVSTKDVKNVEESTSFEAD